MPVEIYLNVAASGLLTGLVYGLMALGLSVIFGVVRVVNFAHGEMMTVAMYLTGLGPTNPPIQTNTPGPGAEPFARTVDQPTVTVDGAQAQVVISLYAPFLYTAYQINFVVPPGTAAGNRQLRVNSGGVASNVVSLPVGP